jgi:predicted tellurium resistance membrane protein TerC
MKLTDPLFSVLSLGISGRDLILIAGGLFLIAKSTLEIHDKLEGEEEFSAAVRNASFSGVIIQILLIDVVFSLDSVITAIGMVNELGVMVTAVVIAVLFMMAFSGMVSDFVEQHPTIKMLALSFLLLIGVALVADGLGLHIPKGYMYFSMAFSVFVEMLNLKIRKRYAPLKLRKRYKGKTS